MDAQRIDRLHQLLHRTPPVWHAGRTVGRTVYQGDGPDDMIGVMDTRELAEIVVLAYEYARSRLMTDGG